MPAATISCSKHMGTAFLDIVPGEIGTILLQSQCNCLDNYTGTLQRGEKKNPLTSLLDLPCQRKIKFVTERPRECNFFHHRFVISPTSLLKAMEYQLFKTQFEQKTYQSSGEKMIERLTLYL